jgi:hypothetical protein
LKPVSCDPPAETSREIPGQLSGQKPRSRHKPPPPDKKRSPVTVGTALRASKADQFERQGIWETSLHQNLAQAPIRASLFGLDRCEAEGVTVRGSAPVLALCRELIAAGFNPATPLEAWRDETLCLRVRSISEGARLTVKAAGNGCPIFAQRDGREGAAASPVRQKAVRAIKGRPRRPMDV